MLGVLTVVGANILYVAQPLFVGYAVDELKAGIEHRTFVGSDLLMYAGLIVLFSLVSGYFTFMTRQTIIVVSRKIEFDLRNDLLAHLQKLDFPWFQHRSTGDLMAHATNDISAVRTVVGPGIMYPLDTILLFAFVLTMMLMKDWELTLYTLIPMPVASFTMYYLSRIVHVRFKERQEQYSDLTTRAQETLSGIRVVKAYVREEFEIGRFGSLSYEYLKKNLVLARVQSIIWPLMFVIIGVMFVIAIYGGGVNVIEKRMTIGSLTAFLSYLLMLIWPMIAFGWVTTMLQQGAASMGRLAAIFDTVPDIRDSKDTDHAVTTIEGSIEFRNITFTHKNASAPALKNVSLTIPKGSTLAIVGRTGSGKTTLVNLIPRLYDPTEGTVLIDGKDVRTIPLETLRSNIGVVPQETFLYSETIRENIAYGSQDGAAPEHVALAADISQISADSESFPKGYDTMIGERGITLSGGQKQRTSIARAVMRDPKILILDDALSAVDTATEDRILHRLRDFMKGRTSIIISHRISTVKDADMIVVLGEGGIAEQGTHEELIELGGLYADLYERQLLEEELEELG